MALGEYLLCFKVVFKVFIGKKELMKHRKMQFLSNSWKTHTDARGFPSLLFLHL